MRTSRFLTAFVCLTLITAASAVPTAAAAAASSLRAEKEALYRPADAKSVKIRLILPPKTGKAGAGSGGGDSGNGCPETVNIGSVQGEHNRIHNFDSTVVINAPVYIRC